MAKAREPEDAETAGRVADDPDDLSVSELVNDLREARGAPPLEDEDE